MEVVSSTVFDLSMGRNATSVADVIFLHGLGGSHVFDFCDDVPTLAPEQFLNGIWLRELLPKALNKPVRILSLRIDYATLFASQTRPVLDEVAAHLLHCLSLVGVGTGHRPLVLVCRDMGGIVAKAMMCHAHSHPAYKTLYCNIAGVRSL